MSATSTKRWGRATLRAAEDVADGVRRLVLEPAGPYPAVPPGSHVDVAVRVAGHDDVCSYSLLGTEPDGAVSIAVSRLSCQVAVGEDLDGLVVRVPETQE